MARQFTRSSSQYLDCGSSTIHNVANITIAAWAYADSYRSPAAYDYIIARESSTSPYVGFILRQLFGSARFVISVGANWHEATGTLPSTGTWHHWAGSYDGETVTLWINGTSAGTNTTPSGNMWAPPAGTKTYIGEGYGFTGRYWDGKLAEIGLWNRALSADDIAALADGFAPALFPRGLISYWPLMGRISPEPDWFGGQTGTLVNSPTYADHPPKIIRSRRRNRVFPVAAAATFDPTSVVGTMTSAPPQFDRQFVPVPYF